MTTGLTKLVTIDEHFERTLEQDHKQNPAKLITLQPQELQGQTLKITPQTSPSHSPRGSLSKTVPEIDVSCVINGNIENEIVLKSPVQILQHQLKMTHIGSSQSSQNSRIVLVN